MKAKIINGEIVFAPYKIDREIDGEMYTTYNPTDEMLSEQGWLSVIETSMPDNTTEGYHYEASYVEDNNEIVRIWSLVADPEPSNEISADEALAIIMGGAV